MPDLELATTEELMEEIHKRSTDGCMVICVGIAHSGAKSDETASAVMVAGSGERKMWMLHQLTQLVFTGKCSGREEFRKENHDQPSDDREDDEGEEWKGKTDV